MFQKLIKNYWHFFVLAILAVAFFIGASGYIYYSPKGNFIKWGSPDETANYIFTKLYSQEGKMEIFEKYNLFAGDIMRPRSMRSDFGFIKPVSFLGIILIYGKIASVFGYKIIPYLTPFFGALGIVFFYFLIKEIFNRRVALISALLLSSFPVYIYYSARSMFHNVLFMVLLIVSLYFAVLMVKRRPTSLMNVGRLAPLFFAGLAGFFAGLAVIARTSEALWVVPMFFILWLFNIRKVGIIKLILFLSFLFLGLLPMLYYNQILYGGFWSGGYPEMNSAVKNIVGGGMDILKGSYKAYLINLRDNIFHFGFHPRKSFNVFNLYFVKMFYWLFWPAVLGFFLFLRKIKKWKKKNLAYLVSYFVISLILIFYYGSWDFHDNPDPSAATIGNSYTRYWLPVYLGAMPFASIFILKITKIFKKNYVIVAGRAIIIILIFFISIKFVLAGSEEGLITSFYKHREARAEQGRVLELTENNSVIITKYHDKLLFPERKVIVGLFDDNNMLNEYSKLADLLPLYYFNFTLPERDIEYLNNKRLAEFWLGIEEVGKVSKDFTLYKLERTKKSY